MHITLPYIEKNGQQSDADRVMADFNAIKDVVNGDIESINIKSGSLTVTNIANNAVETDKIKDGQVTRDKITDETSYLFCPMGTIVAVHPDLKDTQLPDSDYWKPCDGVADLPALSFNFTNDTKVPDLTDTRLLLGSTAYGVGGDNDLLDHTHSYTQPDNHSVTQPEFRGNSHNHTVAVSFPSGNLYFYDINGTSVCIGAKVTKGIWSELELVHRVVASEYSAHYTDTSGSGNCNSTGNFAVDAHANGAVIDVAESRTDANLPKYFKTKFYIRVA